MRYRPVTPEDFAQLDGLEGWRNSLNMIRTAIHADSFDAAGAFVHEVAALADQVDHHPDIAVRYPGVVQISLSTHVTGGITNEDVDLARSISERASAHGYAMTPGTTQALELALDTDDIDRIRPFWAAVLAYVPTGDDGLKDPTGVGPPFWFQTIDAGEPLRTERNRFHLDISVPHDQADARLAAALEAGGTLMFDGRVRAFWVLADADGNECCICTWEDR